MRRLKTVRRPPIYPKSPGHLPCSSLSHPLPLPSRPPSVSFGGFGLKGIEGSVAVYRDSYGIPHVRAGSAHDAFFGQGFVTAQDRLFHMDHERRFVYGRWAELAGEAALEQDVAMRRFQVHESVRVDYEALNPETRAMMDAYAAGVNAFIDTTESLPFEYSLVDAVSERWEPWDCIAAFKRRHILFGVYEAKLWRARLVSVLGPENAARVQPGYRDGEMLIMPPDATYLSPGADILQQLTAGADVLRWLSDTDGGSNSWAVSGDRTESGKPFLAGDSHRPLDTPNVYYQNHIACPQFDAMGLSFPGFPAFPHFGHNGSVAWCVTHAAADYQDLYVERFKEGSPPRYLFKGEWREAEVRHEVISARGGRQVETDVFLTHHGPVISGGPDTGHGIAFKYTATAGPNRGFQCLLPMLMASSADSIDESMREWVDPSNNFVFADIHGNIGYLNRGKLPVRTVANAWLPVPGWTGEHEWQGFVPFEEVLRFRNPDTGYIVTCNNRIAGEDYPHYIGTDFAPEYRARRIAERLKPLHRATLQDMAAVHAERVSIPARTFARLLSTVSPEDELSAQAQGKLGGSDGSMDRDAVQPTIYSAFRWRLNRALHEHNLGPLAHEALQATGRGAPFHLHRLEATFHELAQENDTGLLLPDTDWGTMMSRALAEGVADLRARLGNDMESWTWDSVHVTRPRHPLSASFPEVAALLDPPSVPLGGDADTPLRSGYDPSGSFEITGVSVNRYVFDTSDWDNSGWVIPLGASGHPGSPHYADQVPAWAAVELLPMLYSWDKVQQSAKTVQELKPG